MKTPVLNSRQFLKAPMLMASSEQNDCSVRALANAADVPYDDAHAFWELHGRKPGRGTYTYRTLDRGTKEFPELGFRSIHVGGDSALYGRFCWDDVKRRYVNLVPATPNWTDSGTTLRAFCRQNPRGSFFIDVARHSLAVIDGVIIDWNGSDLRRIRDVWRIEKL